MNKKQKPNVDREPPVWLVNLVIKLRVARWRLVERLNRWAAGKKPWQLRLYFMLFLISGILTYYAVLVGVFRPLHGYSGLRQKILNK